MTKAKTKTPNGIETLTRRQIRYVLFRLQTEAEGGNEALPDQDGPLKFVNEIKKHMESQDGFGGWRMFAKTWDIDETSPLVVVKRNSSIYSDWNNVLQKEAKDLPVVPPATKIIEPAPAKKPKGSPTRDASGKFVSKAPRAVPVVEELTTPQEETTPPKKSFWEKLKE